MAQVVLWLLRTRSLTTNLNLWKIAIQVVNLNLWKMAIQVVKKLKVKPLRKTLRLKLMRTQMGNSCLPSNT